MNTPGNADWMPDFEDPPKPSKAMTDTPRTDALQIAYRKAWAERNEKAAVDALLESHDDLEKELAREKLRAEENGKLAHNLGIRLASERALADRLAEVIDGLDWMEASPPQALAAWKAARDEASH